MFFCLNILTAQKTLAVDNETWPAEIKQEINLIINSKDVKSAFILLKKSLPSLMYFEVEHEIETYIASRFKDSLNEKSQIVPLIKQFSDFLIDLNETDRENFLEIFNKLNNVASPNQLVFYLKWFKKMKDISSKDQFSYVLESFKDLKYYTNPLDPNHLNTFKSLQYMMLIDNLIDLQNRMIIDKEPTLKNYLSVIHALRSYKQRINHKDKSLQISNVEFLEHQDILLNKRKPIIGSIKLDRYTDDIVFLMSHRIVDYDFKSRRWDDYIGYDSVIPRSEDINKENNQSKLPLAKDHFYFDPNVDAKGFMYSIDNHPNPKLFTKNRFIKGFIKNPMGYKDKNGKPKGFVYNIAYTRFERENSQPVLNVHGFINAQAAYDLWSKFQYIAGYDVWEISQPGYGSDGEKTLLKDDVIYEAGDYAFKKNILIVDAAMTHIFNVTGKPVILSGFSMGGMTEEAFIAGCIDIDKNGNFILDEAVAKKRRAMTLGTIPIAGPGLNLRGVDAKIQAFTRIIDPILNIAFKNEHGHVPLGIGGSFKNPKSKSLVGRAAQGIGNIPGLDFIRNIVLKDMGHVSKLGFDQYNLDIMFTYRYSIPSTDSLRSMNELFLKNKDIPIETVVATQIPRLQIFGTDDALASYRELFDNWTGGYEFNQKYGAILMDNYGHVNLMSEEAIRVVGARVLNFMNSPETYFSSNSAFESLSDSEYLINLGLAKNPDKNAYLSAIAKRKKYQADKRIEEVSKFLSMKQNSNFNLVPVNEKDNKIEPLIPIENLKSSTIHSCSGIYLH